MQLFLMAAVVIFLICEKMFHLLLKLAPFTWLFVLKIKAARRYLSCERRPADFIRGRT